MGEMASQITSLPIVYSAVYSSVGDFPAQMASNAEYASIWWRHHDPSDQGVELTPWTVPFQ